MTLLLEADIGVGPFQAHGSRNSWNSLSNESHEDVFSYVNEVIFFWTAPKGRVGMKGTYPLVRLEGWNFLSPLPTTTSEEERVAGGTVQSSVANNLIRHVCVIKPL